MRNFILQIPTKIYFGDDQMDHLKEELRQYGKNVLLVYGGGSIKKTGLYDRIVREAKEAGMTLYELGGIEPNPRHTSVNKGADMCREYGIDVVLAAGGGSTIDAAKMISAAACYGGDCWDLVTGKAPIEKVLPLVTILTIAATGSEMDKTSVISNLDLHKKKGCSSPLFYPKASFLDPTNTFTVSPYQTACGAADILSHTMETYFCREEGMLFTDTVMEGLMRTVIQCAPVAMKEPDNYDARANLMWTSSWAINGFVRASTPHPWSCHQIEHELSAYYDITHGLGLAIVTPRYLRHFLSDKTVRRYYEFGVYVFGIDASLPEYEVAEQAIERLEEFLFETLGLTDNLTDLGITDEHFEAMAESVAGERPHPGFVDMTKEDIVEILYACL